MSNGILFSESDLLLKKLLLKKDNPSKSFIRNCNSVFNDIYKIFGYTPSQLIDIAKKEENQCSNEFVFEINNRKISEIQFKYYDFLSERNYSENTKKLKLSIYRNFLKEFNIEKPKTISFEVISSKNKELSMDDVFKTLSICNSLRDKAIISFSLSSGINLSDLIELKIYDLLCAFDLQKFENNSLESLLKMDPWEFVPSWKLGEKYFFNTPEATFYIFEYLKSRDNIKLDEALFKSQRGNHLNPDSLTYIFFKLNKKLGYESNNHNNYGKFRFTNLKKLFVKSCLENNIDSKNITKKDYEKLIPYLTINSTNNEKYLEKQIQEKDFEIRELKKEIKKLKHWN